MSRSMWVIGCLVALAAVAATQAQTVTLKTGYEPGTYVMTTTVDMTQATVMSDGEGMDQKVQMLIAAELEVSPADATGQTIRMTYKRIANSIEGGPVEMAYDSADPSGSDARMAFLAILLDKPIEVKLDATGKIVSASGMNEALDAVAAEDPTKAQMVQGLKEQYGSNQAAQMVDWGGKMMPPGPVAVGASWDRQYAEAIPMIGEVDVKQTCALKELKSSPTGKIAVISFTVTAEKDEITRPAGEGGMEMTFSDIKMGQTGTLELMLDSGMPLSQTTDQTMAMAIAMKRPAAPAAEGQAPPEAPAMQMTTKQASKVRATLTPGKYVPPVIAPVAPVAPEAPAAPPVPAAEPAPTAEPAPVAE